jgi:hypothetical protein
MTLEWLVSTCMLLINLTFMCIFISCIILRMTLVEDCYSSHMLIFLSLVLVTSIGLEVTLINSPLLAVVPLLVIILLSSIVKNSMLLPVLVLRLRIELWLILLPRCYGFALSFMSWVLMLLLLCRCIARVMPLFLLLVILFSMSIPNILWLAAIFQDLLIEKQIVATYVRSNDHMGDILAKPLLRDSFQ